MRNRIILIAILCAVSVTAGFLAASLFNGHNSARLAATVFWEHELAAQEQESIHAFQYLDARSARWIHDQLRQRIDRYRAAGLLDEQFYHRAMAMAAARSVVLEEDAGASHRSELFDEVRRHIIDGDLPYDADDLVLALTDLRRESSRTED